MEYKQIRAVYDEKTIRIYQAYCHSIAQEAVTLQTFGKNFKLSRMTWIKPSFLWMMYRCGWGLKENQENILAIDMTREGFDFCVKHAVPSSPSSSISPAIWKQQVQTSDIRVQFDPERDIQGNPLPYRSIQLGLRGNAVQHYVHDWIVKITDITDYVADLRIKKEAGEDISPLLPKEQIYPIIIP